MWKFFKKISAELDDAISQDYFDAGQESYMQGNYAAALAAWQPLAKHGDAQAQHKMGLIYGNGKGVDKDYKEALKWFRAAAEQGNPDAQANLGVAYSKGLGVAENAKEAAKWFALSAEQEHTKAQVALGAMYESGSGVMQNYVTAYMWLTLAATASNEDAVEGRAALAKKMDPSDVTKAQDLAEKWSQGERNFDEKKQKEPWKRGEIIAFATLIIAVLSIIISILASVLFTQ